MHCTIDAMEDTLARLAVLKYVVMHSRAVRLTGALVASGGLVGLIWKMALNRHRRNRLRHLRERKQEERRKAIEQLRAIVRKSNVSDRVCVHECRRTCMQCAMQTVCNADSVQFSVQCMQCMHALYNCTQFTTLYYNK